jgi:hypothetical protein
MATAKKRVTVAKPVESKLGLLRRAFLLLEITPEAVEAAARIEHLFKPIGGQRKVWEILEGSEEPDARRLVDLWRRLTKAMQAVVPFEAYCVAAGLATKKAFALVAAETMEQSAKATELLAKASHPAVVEATVQAALKPLGTHDRKMLHQAAGFVPVPKTSVTNFFGGVSIDQSQQTANVAVLPPIEQSVRGLSSRFNDMAALPASAEIIEGDEENEEDTDDDDA